MYGLNRRAPGALSLLATVSAAAALAACGGSDNPAGPNGQGPDPCATDPNLPTCPGPPGSFAFLPELSLPISFTAQTVRQVLAADINGDGRMDLVYNERHDAPSLNRIHVAFGQANGGFTVSPPVDNGLPPPAEGWRPYRVLVADVNGDGDDDLVWNHLQTNNVVYVGLSSGTGNFTFGPRQVHTQTVWDTYTAAVGDMNGDGKEDLVWNARSTASTRTYIGFASGTDGTLTMINNGIDRLGDYSDYDPMQIGRFNADAFDDVALSAISSTRNDTYVGLFTPLAPPTGSLEWSVHSRGTGWATYRLRLGDVDGVNGTDLIWVRTDATNTVIHKSINNGSGTFTFLQANEVAPLTGNVESFVGDFDDDGRSDVLLNRLASGANEIVLAYGTAEGRFTVREIQTNPRSSNLGWLRFELVLVGDVSGDGKADIVWHSDLGEPRMFVALAR